MKKSRRIFKIISIVLLMAILFTAALFATTYFSKGNLENSNANLSIDKKYVSGGYMPHWVFKEREDLEKYDFTKLTHVFYSFAKIDSKSYLPILTEDEARKLRLLKEETQENPNLKLILSIGGAGASYFCEASSSDGNRKAFANECEKIIKSFGLDGVDVDWEFPGIDTEGITRCDNCKDDHYLLLKEIREMIGGSLLTIAVGAAMTMPYQIETSRISAIVDFVNVMNYDYNDTNHASLSFTKLSVFLWNLNGFKKEQLVIGVPFYGRSKTEKYQWMGYDRIKEYIASGEGKLYQKNDQSYLKIGDSKISFDTPEQIKRKVQWVQQYSYGGIFCWQLSTDSNNELLNTMSSINS